MANESHPHRPLLPYLRSVVEAARSSTARSPELRAALDALVRAAKPERRQDVVAITLRFWDAAGCEVEALRPPWIAAVMKDVEGLFEEVEPDQLNTRPPIRPAATNV